jgi:hypothetical protein
MLVKVAEILSNEKSIPEPESSGVFSLRTSDNNNSFIGSPEDSLKKYIGEIPKDKMIHFVTNGRWSMHDLLVYILKQTGPADVLVSTWSISELAIRTIVQKYDEGLILSIAFLADPRIKVRNPKPLQMLSANFHHKLKADHAKVTTIENDSWNISIVGSANFTNNPRIERGIIIPFKDVFEFDKAWITDEIYS